MWYKVQIFLLLLVSVSWVSALFHTGTAVKDTVSQGKFHSYVHTHTHKSSVKQCPDFNEKLQGANNKLDRCISSNYDPERQSFCHFVDSKMRHCLDPLKHVLENCLPKQSQDVPKFLVDSLMSLFHFVCKSKGRDLFELTNPCITHSLSDDVDNECQQLLLMKMLQYQDQEFPTKTEICEFVAVIRDCIQRRLGKHCESSLTINDFLKFYDAIFGPCKNK